jgi:predicted 3-demethylubiquinone-9 3-methyltransferase (glyoxalase superfamily)
MQHQDEVLTSDEFGISWLVKPDDLVSLVVTTKKKKNLEYNERLKNIKFSINHQINKRDF